MNFRSWAQISSSLNLKQRTLRGKLQRDPYYRLRSHQEVAIAAQLGLKIDVNRASIDDWLRLPGISIHQARALVELVGMGVQLLCIEDIAAAISTSRDRLKPLEPVLYFCYYDPESFISPPRANPNIATLEQLAQIPVIDEAMARQLVENRSRDGAYRNLADIQRRLNLSSALTAQLMHYLQW
ncbi:MAG: ComEA family DNA-binding protein [Cyanobacteriota bacterium]|nr:ComEA family DNA-binding protein [Cyanobacteriota bacterium]